MTRCTQIELGLHNRIFNGLDLIVDSMIDTSVKWLLSQCNFHRLQSGSTSSARVIHLAAGQHTTQTRGVKVNKRHVKCDVGGREIFLSSVKF